MSSWFTSISGGHQSLGTVGSCGVKDNNDNNNNNNYTPDDNVILSSKSPSYFYTNLTSNLSSKQSCNKNQHRKVHELVKVLYPPSKKSFVTSTATTVSTSSINSTSSNLSGSSFSVRSSMNGGGSGTQGIRFSQLLLDPGEKPVQDWAVVAFSVPSSTTSKRSTSSSTGNSSSRHHNTTTNKSVMTTNDTRLNTNMIQDGSQSNKTTTTEVRQQAQIQTQSQSQSQQQQQQQQQQQEQEKQRNTQTKKTKKQDIKWFQSPDYKNKNKSDSAGGGTNTTPGNHRNYRQTTSSVQHNRSSSSLSHNSIIDTTNNTNMDPYHATTTTNMKNIQGRLYLCTGSLVFEPNDWSRGIIRFPFSKMDHGPPVSTTSTSPEGTTASAGNNGSSKLGRNSNSNNVSVSSTITGSYETILNVQFQCRRHMVMKEDNQIGPYRQVSIPTEFRFVFLHSSPTHFLEMTTELFNRTPTRYGSYNPYNNNMSPSRSKSTPTATSTKLTTSSNSNSNGTILRQNSHGLSVFDASNLVDVREQIQTTIPIPCSIVLPLQNQSGVMILTNERIYFQKRQWSYYAPVLKWTRSSITATARRYNGLRDSALEIYFEDAAGMKNGSRNNSKSRGLFSSVLFGFERRHDRELVINCLQKLQNTSNEYMFNNYNNNNVHEPFNRSGGKETIPCLTDREFVVQVANEWRRGTVSNYEYLLALNCAAGRTFHDLSRYPVFPWIIQDYNSHKLDLEKESTFRDLSKPIGALNPERLQYFRSRFQNMAQDMSDELFLFGTHYSAAGYVLYYLVRSMPEHMLCLQNGKFDSPDRMFYSVASCYNCVLTNHADIKELIPEFYSPALDYDFLINARGLQLGATQNGERVNDVKLPPWAKDSPREFIKQNIAALECDRTSQNLPQWIDLIFGSKSRGQSALDANNLFHHYSYLGPNDLASMQSEEDRATAELQATEFGIVPDQLFVMDHPSKFKFIPQCTTTPGEQRMDDSFISLDIGRNSSVANKDDPAREAWELLDPLDTVENGNRQNDYDGLHDSYVEDNNHKHDSDQHTNNDAVGSNDKKSLSTKPNTTMNDRDLQLEGDATKGSSLFSGADGNRLGLEVEKVDHQLRRSTTTSASNTSVWDMQIIEKKRIHNDAISGCVLLFDDNLNNNDTSTGKIESILATTSLDGGLKFHFVSLASSSSLSPYNNEEDKSIGGAISSTLNRFSSSYNTILNRGPGGSAGPVIQSKLTEYRSHTSRDPLACLVLASDNSGGTVAFTGGHDDVVLAYGIKSGCAVASVYSHRDAVTGLDLIERTPFDSESSIWLENSTHIMISGSWDATVKVWSASVAAGEAVAINREPLAELFDADSSVVCVSALRSHLYKESEHDTGIVVAAGCVDGSFCVWMLHSDGVQVLIHKEPTKKGSGPCSVLKWISESGNMHLFAAFSTGKIASYRLNNASLKRESAVSIGTAVLSMVFTNRMLLVGCADGSLRLLSMAETGMCFNPKSRPVLWNSLHNADSSPGISSICIAYCPTKNNSNESLSLPGRKRIVCCSGAEDGSIVLFELKEG